jgi:hypothetical protein
MQIGCILPDQVLVIAVGGFLHFIQRIRCYSGISLMVYIEHNHVVSKTAPYEREHTTNNTTAIQTNLQLGCGYQSAIQANGYHCGYKPAIQSIQ